MLPLVSMVVMTSKVRKESKGYLEDMLKRTASLGCRYFLNLVKAQRVLKRHATKVHCLKVLTQLMPVSNGPSVVMRGLKDMLLSELVRLPNRLHFSVPVVSQVMKVWGLKSVFSSKVKDHIAIGRRVGIDISSGSWVVGTRFGVLKEPASMWSRYLVQLMLDTQTKEHLYGECNVPYIVSELSLYLTGHLPKFRREMFQVLGGDLVWYLIPTAEVVLINLVRDVTLRDLGLPLRLVAHSSCFRLEHSVYGRDNRGLLRQRQFDKVEIIQVTTAARSYRALDEVLKDAEMILRKLKLHYRVVDLSAVDTGLTSSKTFDIEIWLPSFLGYKEVSSCSNTEDYQAMRLQVKHSMNQQKYFVNIINGSGLAVGRTLVALLENNQDNEGLTVVTQPFGLLS